MTDSYRPRGPRHRQQPPRQDPPRHDPPPPPVRRPGPPPGPANGEPLPGRRPLPRAPRPLPQVPPDGFDAFGTGGTPPPPPPPPRRLGPLDDNRPPPRRIPPPDETPTEVLRFGGDLPGDHRPRGRDRFYDDEPYDEYDDYEDEYDDLVDEELHADHPDLFDPDEDLEDDLDEEPAKPEPRRRRRAKKERKRARRMLSWMIALVVIVLLAGAAVYGARELLGWGYDDFEGNGESDVIVKVAAGDSTKAIGTTLANAGVVASPKAFVKAAEDNDKVLGIQPGFYNLKTKMSGQAAVSKLVAPDARVGELQVTGGAQLDDVTLPDGKVADGLITQLSKASCAQLNGKSTCVPPAELRKVVETGDLAALGVPQWALEGASKAEPKRRIEGLIMPGLYDIRPGSDATQVLKTVLTDSAAKIATATGLPEAAGPTGRTPYQILIVASLIEREAVTADFGKVARVLYNRLAYDKLDGGMRLELDSTVNYVLDRPYIRTNPEDRGKAGAYNTYQIKGLTPTPIAAPSKEAIQAALKPADGKWLFFVKCDRQSGISCFAETIEEHNQNVRDAQARGAY